MLPVLTAEIGRLVRQQFESSFSRSRIQRRAGQLNWPVVELAQFLAKWQATQVELWKVACKRDDTSLGLVRSGASKCARLGEEKVVPKCGKKCAKVSKCVSKASAKIAHKDKF